MHHFFWVFAAINKHNQHLTKHPGAYSAAGAGSVSFSFFCSKNENAIALPHGKARADWCKHTTVGRLVLITVTDAKGDALLPTNEQVA